MIVNPYSEVLSLHDMNIIDFSVEASNALIKLSQAVLISAKDDYIIDNPLIIVNDLIDIKTNDDYPIRIKLISGEQAQSINSEEFNQYNFTILEEAYGFGLVHFYGIAIKGDKAFDCFIDIHYCGNLEIKWDSKVLVEI